jgi:peptide/nickel transport system substrate-binding protein
MTMEMTRRRAIAVTSAGVLAPTIGYGQPAARSRLNVLVQPEPPTLMLGINQQGPVELVGSKIYESLLTYDFDLKPQPVLAREWSRSPDGLLYTFKLQDGVRWHDGHPFTSADVVFSLATFLPETNPRARGILINVESVTAPDAATVEIRLKAPFGPFLGGFVPSNMAMIPRHLYEGTDFRTNPANLRPIGTGPFKFAEWQRGQHIRLVRNEQYHRTDQPKVDEIIFHVVPDASSRAFALETQTMDIAGPDTIELFDIARLTALPHIEATARGSEFASPMTFLEMNHRVEPLNDKRFRQAILHAIDRNFIKDSIWFGHGRVPNGPIASTTRFHDPSIAPRAFSPERAEALLDEMGLRRGANGMRVTLSLIPLPYGETWRRLGEYIRQALARVGIGITIETMDGATWIQRVSNWNYQLTINRTQQFGDPAIGVARTYLSSNIRRGVMFNNTMGYENPKVDDLFARAASAVSDDERRALYAQVQAILTDEVPVGWLLEIRTPTLFNKRFKNVITTGLGVNDSFATAAPAG